MENLIDNNSTMGKVQKLIKILDENNLNIDIQYLYDENEDFDELEEKVFQYINEEEIIYYHKAMDYLSKEDSSLSESLEIASEYGYTTENLNSELLATLLFQKNLLEQWGEVSAEIEEIINE